MKYSCISYNSFLVRAYNDTSFLHLCGGIGASANHVGGKKVSHMLPREVLELQSQQGIEQGGIKGKASIFKK